MIALYQVDGNSGKLLPPQFEELHFVVFAAMEHIAHNDDPYGQIMCDQLLQPEKVFLHNAGRHSDPGLPEMGRLPEMEVRKDQRFLFFPKNCPLGQQMPMLFLKMKYFPCHLTSFLMSCKL
jgi:hypothetical protein